MSQLKPAIWLAPSFVAFIRQVALPRNISLLRMIIHLPIPDRDPGPFPAERRCVSCRCFLSRNNPRGRCAPCELAAMPACEVVDLYPENAA